MPAVGEAVNSAPNWTLANGLPTLSRICMLTWSAAVSSRGGGRPWPLSFRQSHHCRGCVTFSSNQGLMVPIEAINRIVWKLKV